MPCGCTDNKLNNNESLNKDKLSLDAMKGLSIDEIISLYKQGYVLESTEYVESMTYGTDCTGSVTVDRQLTPTGSLASMTMQDAAAQRFVPTSRCLKSVTLRLSRVLDNDVYVEIRTDSGGLPLGNPMDSGNKLGSTIIPYSAITQTFLNFGEVTATLDIILPNLDPIWIVTCLYAYIVPCPYDGPCLDTSYHVDGGGTGTGTATEYGARKSGPNNWSQFGSLYFKTNKQTYGPPAPASISVAPTTASVDVGATTQLTATCKDTDDITMNCPILTWTSSDDTKATVSPDGLVTGEAAGSANITASAGTVTSNASVITVNVPTHVLGTISVTPTSQSINIGGVVQLTATCKDTDDITMNCPILTWTSSDDTKATVSPDGLVTGEAAGSANITASAGTVISNISAITVTGIVSTLTSIAVSPTSASIVPTGTKQFTVVCKDQNLNTMVCPTLTWLSSNTPTATINSTGLATGVAVGSTNITASAAGVTSNTAILTITTVPPSAGAGGAMMIAAIAAIGIAYFMMKKPPTGMKKPPTGMK